MKKVLILLVFILTLVACGGGNTSKEYKTIGDIPSNINLEVTSIGININNGGTYLVIKMDDKYGLLEASKEDAFALGDNYKRVLSSDFANNKLKFIKWENDFSKLDKWAEKEDIILEEIKEEINNVNPPVTNTVDNPKITEFNTVGDLFDAGYYNIVIKELYFNESGNVFLASNDEGMWFLLEKPHWHNLDLEEEYTSGSSYDYMNDILATVDFNSGDKIYKAKTFSSEKEATNYLISNGFYVGG